MDQLYVRKNDDRVRIIVREITVIPKLIKDVFDIGINAPAILPESDTDVCLIDAVDFLENDARIRPVTTGSQLLRSLCSSPVCQSTARLGLIQDIHHCRQIRMLSGVSSVLVLNGLMSSPPRRL